MIYRANATSGKHRLRANRLAAAGSYAGYVGRVGALAVALGVGTAVALPGVGWATPDTTSPSDTAGTPSTPSDTSGGAETTSEPSTPSADPSPSTSPVDTAAPTPVTGTSQAETVSEGSSPPVTISGSGGANTTINGSAPAETEPAGESATPNAETTTAPQPEPKPSLPKGGDSGGSAVDVVNTSAPAATTTIGLRLTVPAQDATAGTDTNPTTAPMFSALVAEPAAAATMVADATPPPVAPSPETSVATQVVTSILTPLLGSSPNAPLSPALAWAVLAFARRETTTAPEAQAAMLTNTAAPGPNKAPTAAPTITGVDLETGVVTGNLNASDPNGDPLTFSPSQPKKGTVVIASDGTFTYTPTDTARHAASATAAEDFDAFSVTIRDGRGGIKTTTVRNVPITPTNEAPVDGDYSITSVTPSTGTVKGIVTADDPDDDKLTYQGTTTTAKGRVTVSSTGAFTYTPTAAARHAAVLGGDAATDSFTVTVTDAHGGTLAVPVSVTITPANHAPVYGKATVGKPDPITGVVTGTVKAVDADKDPLTYIGPTSTTKGSVVVQTNGSFTYTPTQDARQAAAAGGAAAKDTFTVVVSDGYGGTQNVTVNVAVSPNRAPVNGIASVGDANPNSGIISGFVRATDPDRDPVTYSGTADTEKGSVVVASNGSFTYTPDPEARAAAHGSPMPVLDSFTITASDGRGGTLGIPVSVVVTPSNSAPEAVADPTVGTPNSAGVVTGLVNVEDADDDALSYAVVDGPTYGNVTFDSATGTYTYTPTEAARLQVTQSTDTVETDSFTVAVSDGASAPVTVTVDNILVAELPANSVVATPEVGDGPTAIIISSDGTRAYVANTDDDTVTVLQTSDDSTIRIINVGDQPVALALNSDGSILYVATAGDSSVVSIDTVSFAVGEPIVVHGVPNAVEVSPDDTLVITANANDTITIIDVATGTTTPIDVDPIGMDFSPDGRYLYLANTGLQALSILDTQNGYQQTNVPIGANPIGVAATDTHVYVTLTDEDRVAVVDRTAANNVTYITVGDQPRGIDVTTDGRVYVANYGSDTVTVIDTATGNTSTVDVGDGPWDVTVDPVNNEVSITNKLSDTVTVLLTAGNTPPVVTPTVNDPDPTTGAVTGTLSTTDADGHTLTYSVGILKPENGTVDINSATGEFTYTPDDAARHVAAFTPEIETDTFELVVDDGHGAIVTKTLTVTMLPRNETPVAGDDNLTLDEDGVLTGSLLDNDTDADNGDTLTVISNTAPAHGAVAVNTDGTFTYTPDANYHGVDTFTYTVSDGADSDTGTVTVTVVSVNDAPTAQNISLMTPRDTEVTVDALANAVDIDGDTLTPVVTQPTTHGTLQYNGDGTFKYTPDPGYHGGDSFTFTVSDGVDTSSVATVTINVNSAPSANVVTATPVNGMVLTDIEYVDPDNDGGAIYFHEMPTEGTLQVIGTKWVYQPTEEARVAAAATPGKDYDRYTLRLEDGFGGVSFVDVDVEIAPAGVITETTVPGQGGAVFTKDGWRAVSWTTDGTETVLRVIDTDTQPQHGQPITLTGNLSDVQITEDGTRAVVTAVTYNGNSQTTRIAVIDVNTGEQVGQTITLENGGNNSINGRLQLSNDGTLAAVTTSNQLALVNTLTGEQIGSTITGVGDRVDQARISPDGTRITWTTYTYNQSNRQFTISARVYDTADATQVGNTISLIGDSQGRQPQFSADGTRALFSAELYNPATDTSSTQVKVIDITDGTQIGNTLNLAGSLPNDQSYITPDGTRGVITTYLYARSTNTFTHEVRVINTDTAAQIGTTTVVTGNVQSSAPEFNADGTRGIISTSVNNTSHQWAVFDTTTGNQLGITHTDSGYLRSIQFDTDSDLAYVSTRSTSGPTTNVAVVDTADGSLSAITLNGGPNQEVELRFGPGDKSALITKTYYGMTQGWTSNVQFVDQTTATPIGAVTDLVGEVWDVRYNNDGTRAVVTTVNSTRIDTFNNAYTTRVTVIDTASGSQLADTVVLDGMYQDSSSRMSDDGTRIAYAVSKNRYQSTPAATSIAVISTVSGLQLGETIIENGYNAGISDFHQDREYLRIALAADDYPGSTRLQLIGVPFENTPPYVAPTVEDPVNSIVLGNMNATDVDYYETLTYQVTDDADHGTVSLSPTGGFTYSPTAAAQLAAAATLGDDTDTFTVTVTDRYGGQTSRAVTVEVAPTGVVNEITASGVRGEGVQLSPDGTRAIQMVYTRETSSGPQLPHAVVFDTTTGAQIGVIDLPEGSGQPNFSTNSPRVAFLSSQYDAATQTRTTVVTFADTTTGTRVGDPVTIAGSAHRVTFSADGSLAAVTTTDYSSNLASSAVTSVAIFNALNGSQVGGPQELPGASGEAGSGVTFSPDGDRAYQVSRGSGMTRVFAVDTTTGEQIGQTLEIEGTAHAGTLPITSSGERGFLTVEIYDSENDATTTHLYTIDTDSLTVVGSPIDIGGAASFASVRGATISPDGTRVVQVTADGALTRVVVIDALTSAVISDTATLSGNPGSVQFSSDGSQFIVASTTQPPDEGGFGGSSTQVKLFDSDTGDLVGTHTLTGTQRRVEFTPDGTRVLVVTTSSGRVHVSALDSTTGLPVAVTPVTINGSVSGMTYSQDGKRLFVTVFDNGAKVVAVNLVTGTPDGQVSLGAGVPLEGLGLSADGVTAFQTISMEPIGGTQYWLRVVEVNVAGAPTVGDTIAIEGGSSAHGIKFSSNGERAFQIAVVGDNNDITSFETTITTIDPAPFRNSGSSSQGSGGDSSSGDSSGESSSDGSSPTQGGTGGSGGAGGFVGGGGAGGAGGAGTGAD